MYGKELAHVNMEASKSPNLQSLTQFESEGQQAPVEPGRADVPVQRPSDRIFIYSEAGQPCIPFRPSTDGLTHIMGDNLLYSSPLI